MTDSEKAPRSEGPVSESHEWVTGDGGPSFGEGGMKPGGNEMENWKKVNPNQGDSDPSLEEQAENLRDRAQS